MKYDVIITFNDIHQPTIARTFTRYQSAKRYAKELSKETNISGIWIEGYESIKDEDLDF